MRFGHFDDPNKEYVIERPDTPASWGNYLGSTTYGSIITNNAGGYSFYHSAAQGRFMRWRPNTLPMDQPGRYFYLRDRDSGDYWSASWQPVGKPLDRYQSVCRHGTAYTVIESEYNRIRTETTYFVPLDREFECWLLKVTNRDDRPRRLSVFPFVEYANFWHLWMDWVNLQYTQFIMEMKVVDGIISHGINPLLPYVRGDFNAGGARYTFFAMTGAETAGFDTDREKFIGLYRGYGNPVAVERGRCSGSLAVGGNGCGVFQAEMELKPGESREILVLMGIGQAGVEGKEAVREFSDLSRCRLEFERVKSYWHGRLNAIRVETPDPEFNSMMNVWNPYNCLITYAWSRAASLVYAGERDGLGFRDTVQDILGVLPAIPDEAVRRLELMITGQASTGGAMPVVKQFNHHPGRETAPREDEYRSDDCLWLFNTIPAYVRETGRVDFYEKILPYADRGEESVLGHLRRAIEFNLERSGSHGLPCGLAADWNDCIQLGSGGESVFVAFQLRYALKTYLEICDSLKKTGESAWAREKLTALDDAIRRHAWDGNWFIRGFREDGLTFGSGRNDEGTLWLSPQSWAVLSGHASPEQSRSIMDTVSEKLGTEYGLMICDPPYAHADVSVMKAVLFNKGMKENGSIFCHIQGWAVIAETMLGLGTRAFRHFRATMPAAYNERAEVREIEPYVYCQFTNSPASPRKGASRLPWLSGSAAWSYYAATQHVLGIRPEIGGLRIDPCIPAEWKSFKVVRRFRGRTVRVEIVNPEAVEKGVREMTLNGEQVEGNLLPIGRLKDENNVLVVMGR
jgi:N,N'-diacetylchitobiose phosphorylase